MSVMSQLRAKVRQRVMLDRWRIGIATAAAGSDVRNGTASEITWLSPESDTRYWADPFALERGGRLHVLCEQFDYADPVGRVVALTVEADGSVTEHGEVLDVEGHASFPFLFEHDGEIYCVPETAEAGEVSLHRAVSFPTSWERLGTVIGVPGIDNTVFVHEGRWWLLHCSDTDGGRSELHAWFADALDGPWEPHAQNPIKVDLGAARAAGTPWRRSDGALIRPAQDCRERYGGRVVHCEIVTLTPTDFVERVVAVQEPVSGFVACHTVGYPMPGLAVFDAATTIPMWRHLSTIRYFLREELGRLRS